MERRNSEPEIFDLTDLPQNYEKLLILVDEKTKFIHKEDKISFEAGKIIGRLYDLLLKQYRNPNNETSLKSLNKLCVRLVFCLFADDAGIFPVKKMFHDYLQRYDEYELREKLIGLFKILNTPQSDRDEYLPEELLAFPYVNGGLFDGEIEIPYINYDIKEMLLEHGSKDFNWADISPTIFGSLFESTLNPDTRRAGGMHYTSVENIHKVIDPLFLNSLRDELSEISRLKQDGPRRDKALKFQKKLASLTVLDPACGSGNFLTETYISLRRIENQVLRLIQGYDTSFGEGIDPVLVSPSQFKGIEINDFACAVAQTALWIAELQMMSETTKLFHSDIKALPLKNYQSITEGNALRIDWNSIIPASSLNYIIGNPPFSGARVMDKTQKEDLIITLGKDWKGIGNLDYVSGWYKKSLDMMKLNPLIKGALVSTSSISQGEQVAILWEPLAKEGLKIDFAHRSFIWDSEATEKAHVHCVIEGFSLEENKQKKYIYIENKEEEVKHINGYLIDAQDLFIHARTKPICNVPEIGIGNKPIDGGYYLFSDEEKNNFLEKEPEAEKYFRKWFGADEFLNGYNRWCLWLGDANPDEIINLKECMKIINQVREYRLRSKNAGTRKLASRPTHFHVENIPASPYLLIPETSSENRTYVPIGFMGPENLSSNAVRIIPNAELFHFGILTSSVHNLWLKTVGGRWKSDFRYSKDIVYNNFVWPTVNQRIKKKIEETAQKILDIRAHHKETPLGKMYSHIDLFEDLKLAHHENDMIVLEAYGLSKRCTDIEIIKFLFNQWKKLSL